MKTTKFFPAFFLFILVTFVIIPFSGAQSNEEKSVFWEISGNGLEQSSYLFGTMHLLPRNQFVEYELVKEKLINSSQLILEMVIDVPVKQQIEWAKLMMLPEGETLQKYMTEKEYENIRTYVLDSLKVKEMMFNAYIKFKPFAFYSALLPSIIGEKIEGYELYFSKLASKKKIPVLGLETFEYQMGIFDSIPNEEQLNMFFDPKNDPKKEFEEVLDLYLEQEIYKMADMMKSESDEYAQFEYELLTKRNTEWVPKITGFIQDTPSFIAVGAAHLGGKNGLIKQLRETGFTVTPIVLREE